MTSLCSALDPSAYATGRIAPENKTLFRPGGLELTVRAIALAGMRRGSKVVDIGCGAGQSVAYLRTRGFEAMGIDCAVSDKQAVHPPDSHQHIVANADELPLRDCSTDGVLAECSLSVMQDQERVLAECARVLVDGGRLMISDLYARQPKAIARVRALKRSCAAGMIIREELEARLDKQGFTVDVWEDHSQALRECAARFILEHGSLDGLWQCDGNDSVETIQAAMKAVRAGYFLLVARRRQREARPGGRNDER